MGHHYTERCKFLGQKMRFLPSYIHMTMYLDKKLHVTYAKQIFLGLQIITSPYVFTLLLSDLSGQFSASYLQRLYPACYVHGNIF